MAMAYGRRMIFIKIGLKNIRRFITLKRAIPIFWYFQTPPGFSPTPRFNHSSDPNLASGLGVDGPRPIPRVAPGANDL
ncbi:MAG: hypothetical protein EA390_13420 [Balneolaceae bacterium]|nr:MAG: hypothetical protein EA390_13420 [Balneolaceae bacterium]